MDFRKIFQFIPEVKTPEEKKLSFNVKLKWTLIVLASFFVLANIPLFGLSNNALERFKYLAIILGTDFGSIISLGIGPIVMASVILQLLTGGGIINIDLATTEGKRFFQGIQKILTFFFIVFEAIIYVVMQGLQAAPGFAPLLIFQLVLGGLAIFYMDDLVHKWGFGSGVSLFIGAGASWQLITSAFQFMDQQGRNCLLDFGNTACPGKVFVLIQAVINKYPIELISAAGAIIVTVLIFLAVIWAQSLKVEVPLSYGRLRGYSVKWPLSFFYTSNMPVILTAALLVSFQVFAGIIENAAAPCLVVGGTCAGIAKFASYLGFLGHFTNGQAISGLAFWMGSTNLLELIIRGGFLPRYILQGLTHTLIYMALSTIFAIFWVKTSGMDSKTQAHKIAASGLQIAGFRQDERVLESILDRYIMPLTVMGGIAIGLLASITNLMGALISGTAILLVIMIFFQFYQSIAQQHQTDMNPAFRKFMQA
ncbi:preprotein translocase subunit SecY [Candidatus Pacearchaeota archaeon]|nr:preprotein translocase subunit SecY [Candidatus Pacearchaeota archaeon]